MRQRLLQRCPQEFPHCKFLCFGDYQIGKTEFLAGFTGVASPYSSDCCALFLRLLRLPRFSIGLEFYELPGSANPSHNDCYLDDNYDAILYFFEMTNSQVRGQFVEFLRAYVKSTDIDPMRRLLSTPVLMIGLGKNLCSDRFDHYRQHTMTQFSNIVGAGNMLFFPGDPLDRGSAKPLSRLTAFVETTALKTIGLDLPSDFYIMNSVQSYVLLCSARELVGLAMGAVFRWVVAALRQYKFFEGL